MTFALDAVLNARTDITRAVQLGFASFFFTRPQPCLGSLASMRTMGFLSFRRVTQDLDHIYLHGPTRHFPSTLHSALLNTAQAARCCVENWIYPPRRSWASEKYLVDVTHQFVDVKRGTHCFRPITLAICSIVVHDSIGVCLCLACDAEFMNKRYSRNITVYQKEKDSGSYTMASFSTTHWTSLY